MHPKEGSSQAQLLRASDPLLVHSPTHASSLLSSQLQAATADCQVKALGELAAELGLEPKQLKQELLRQQQRQQRHEAVRKLTLQRMRVETELADCRSRLEAAGKAEEESQTRRREQKQRHALLLKRLTELETQLKTAEEEQQKREGAQREQMQQLQELEAKLESLKDEADELLRKKTAAEAEAEAARQTRLQEESEKLFLLRQADTLGLELPLKASPSLPQEGNSGGYERKRRRSRTTASPLCIALRLLRAARLLAGCARRHQLPRVSSAFPGGFRGGPRCPAQ